MSAGHRLDADFPPVPLPGPLTPVEVGGLAVRREGRRAEAASRFQRVPPGGRHPPGPACPMEALRGPLSAVRASPGVIVRPGSGTALRRAHGASRRLACATRRRAGTRRNRAGTSPRRSPGKLSASARPPCPRRLPANSSGSGRGRTGPGTRPATGPGAEPRRGPRAGPGTGPVPAAGPRAGSSVHHHRRIPVNRRAQGARMRARV